MSSKKVNYSSKRGIIAKLLVGFRCYCNHCRRSSETHNSKPGFITRCGYPVLAKTWRVGSLKEEHGLSLVEFLLILIPFVYLAFSPIFFNSTMDTHDKAKAQLYAFLDRVQVEGYLTAEDEVRLNEEFEKIGCEITGIDGPMESQGDPRILRSDSVDDSLITLKINYRFDSGGLNIGDLVGAQTPESFDFNLEGSVISERVDP